MSGCVSIPWKEVKGEEAMLLDLYLPEIHLGPDAQTRLPQIPAVIYFHGGGMTVGDRKSWFPLWLQRTLILTDVYLMPTDPYDS